MSVYIPTIRSDEAYPAWLPGKAPLAVEPGGSGIAPDRAKENFGRTRIEAELKDLPLVAATAVRGPGGAAGAPGAGGGGEVPGVGRETGPQCGRYRNPESTDDRDPGTGTGVTARLQSLEISRAPAIRIPRPELQLTVKDLSRIRRKQN